MIAIGEFFQLRNVLIHIISSLFNKKNLYYLFVTFMKSALFLLWLQHILFLFSFETNCNDLNFDCFYVLPD